MKKQKKFLIALPSLPSFPNAKGFNHPTVLVSADDENAAYAKAGRLKPNDNLGDIKEVNY